MVLVLDDGKDHVLNEIEKEIYVCYLSGFQRVFEVNMNEKSSCEQNAGNSYIFKTHSLKRKLLFKNQMTILKNME